MEGIEIVSILSLVAILSVTVFCGSIFIINKDKDASKTSRPWN
jgi:hypothetical protein